MAPRRSTNPYLDPSFAAIGSNLVKAFIGDGGKGAYYAAHARKTNLEADALDRKNKGAVSVSDLFRANPQGISSAVTSQLYASALDAGITPDQVNKLALGMAANFGAPDGAVARAFVGAGHALGKDQGVSIADREAVAGRENKAALQRTATSAGIHAGATIQAANIAEAGRMARRYDDPKFAPEGSAAFFTPDDPRFKGVAPGAIPAPKAQTPSTVAGAVLGDVAAGKKTPDTLTPGERFVVDKGHEKPPPHVGPKEIDDVEISVLNPMGAWTKDGTPHPAFVEKYGPRMDAARQAAGAELQKSRDAAKAAKAYREALGIEPGSTFQQPGMVGRLFGAPSGVVPPAGAPAPAAPPPAGPTAPPPAPVAPDPAVTGGVGAPPAGPRIGTTPPRPQNLPPGSQYSPGRRAWRDPNGRMYDEAGSPVN